MHYVHKMNSLLQIMDSLMCSKKEEVRLHMFIKSPKFPVYNNDN